MRYKIFFTILFFLCCTLNNQYVFSDDKAINMHQCSLENIKLDNNEKADLMSLEKEANETNYYALYLHLNKKYPEQALCWLYNLRYSSEMYYVNELATVLLLQYQEMEKAIEIYQEILKKEPNHIDANLYLGNLYYHGYGIQQNRSIAFQHYLKAITHNTSDLGYQKALYKVGFAYNHGIGVNKDTEKALFYYDKLLNKYPKGDNMPILLAQADKYENILNDKKKSFEYYFLAATSGSYIAQRKVRDFYYESNDIDNAEAWNEILKMHDTYINHIVQ